MKMFGVDMSRLKTDASCHRCRLTLEEGDVCFITGPSGAGKSVILSELYQQTPDEAKIDLNDIEIESDRSVVDCIDGELFDSLRLLSMAGLSDVLSILNQPANLSEGQKYRYKLAKSLASGKKIVFADEFCANLDRVTACVIAYHIRKFARRTGTTFVVASSHDDLVGDLLPDVVVIKRLSGAAEVVYRSSLRQQKHDGRCA
jgi:hypothetical protein